MLAWNSGRCRSSQRRGARAVGQHCRLASLGEGGGESGRCHGAHAWVLC